MKTESQAGGSGWKPSTGDRCWLKENDWCGSRTLVTVLKVFKGGNALVLDGQREREVGVVNLVQPPPFDVHASRDPWLPCAAERK